MYNQEIKTKATAAKVAKSLEKDLNDAIGFFDGYKVDVECDSDRYEVYVTSKTYCKILTDSVLGYLFKLAMIYSTQYAAFTYHISTREENRPAFVFSVIWNK